MKLVETRFLRGPNIHRPTPCLVAVLEGDALPPWDRGMLADAVARLRPLLPGGWSPVVVDAGAMACLLARLMSALQAAAGRPALSCDVVRLAPRAPTLQPEATAQTSRWRLVAGYGCETVAKEALRMSVELVSALCAHRTFDPEALQALQARVAELRALTTAATVEPSTRTPGFQGRIPVVAVTGTNGKTTTTQLITHVLRASHACTGMTTTQGIFVDGQCVQTGDCSGFRSARRVLSDPAVQVAVLETARGGILKRGLAFDRCDVGVVLNVSSDHLGLDGVETLEDLAHAKGLVARSARAAAVLNAEDSWCVAMRETLAPGCEAVYFSLAPRHPVLLDHLRAGGAAAWLDDDGWLVWRRDGVSIRVVRAVELPFTWQGHARFNVANALAALAALRCLGCPVRTVARALRRFVSDARSNPLRGNEFEVDGVKLIVDYAHNVAAYRALCAAARSMLVGSARLLGVVTAPGDRRPEDLDETGRVCGDGFDELVVYEQDPRGREAGATARAILQGARSAAPDKPLHVQPRIRQALWQGLRAARPGDVLVFTCAGNFDDLIEGVRLQNPAAAERLAREVPA